MADFTVKRQHLGDRMYMPGETREAEPRDVAHLVDNGVLAPAEAKAEAKAEAPVRNKAATAPENKAR